jgi:hypothetical protein
VATKKTIEITPDVRKILCAGSFGVDLFELPPGQIGRDLYTRVAKVLGAYGVKWNKKRNGFPVTSQQREGLLAALESGTAIRQQVVNQSYYTPDEAADLLIEKVGVTQIHLAQHILEPSVGHGALIRAMLRKVPNPCCETLTVFETDNLAQDGFARALLHGEIDLPSHSRVRHGGDFTLTISRFSHVNQYDVILANPPWASGAAEQHIAIMLMNCMAKVSILGAIVPAGFTERNKELRWAAERRANETGSKLKFDPTVSLPKNSFKESGTAVNAELFIARKTLA